MLAGPGEDASAILGRNAPGCSSKPPPSLPRGRPCTLTISSALSERGERLCNWQLEQTLPFPVVFSRRTGTSYAVGFPAESPRAGTTSSAYQAWLSGKGRTGLVLQGTSRNGVLPASEVSAPPSTLARGLDPVSPSRKAVPGTGPRFATTPKGGCRSSTTTIPCKLPAEVFAWLLASAKEVQADQAGL